MVEEKKVLELIEIASSTGKVKKGINETTKAIERGKAVFVAVAGDVSPKEITMHLPLLCEEKKIPYANVGSKNDLGRACGLSVSCSAVAVIDAGEAKNLLKEISIKK